MAGNGADASYHVIPLSNFARGYDKYARAYDKSHIQESRFGDRFFVLTADDLGIGIEKTSGLIDRIGLEGDRLLVMRGAVDPASLHANTATGKGRYFIGTRFPVRDLYVLGDDGSLTPISVEEAFAASLDVANPSLIPYSMLFPRTLSVLPIARACQASCKFCFSEASASLEQVPHRIPTERIIELARLASGAGASRFVITGGGEPGLVPHEQLLELIGIGSAHFSRTVLITNGVHLARRNFQDRMSRISDYARAGLSVLSVSRHHWDDAVNAEIMGLDTRTPSVIASWRDVCAAHPSLRMRLICVIQRGGVEDWDCIAAYLDWATSLGIGEVCFKELYVSSTRESVYHARPENIWSMDHQVPLSEVTSFLEDKGFIVTSRLPWGSPVYAGNWKGRALHVAAYTEPSLLWERSAGIARSWNVMADGTCLASLEDPKSEVHPINGEKA